jgi:hypothetical protein
MRLSSQVCPYTPHFEGLPSRRHNQIPWPILQIWSYLDRRQQKNAPSDPPLHRMVDPEADFSSYFWETLIIAPT